MLTFLPLEEIDKMDSWEGAQLNTAKEILAFELTKLVHGEEEANKAQESARALFSQGNAAQMPTAELTGSVQIGSKTCGTAGWSCSRRRESCRHSCGIYKRCTVRRGYRSEKR